MAIYLWFCVSPNSIKFIADALGRIPSTISRELKRNKSLRGYRANYADNEARARRSNNAFTIIADVWDWVTDKLKDSWSPEQIAGFHGGISHMTSIAISGKTRAKVARYGTVLDAKPNLIASV